MKALFFSDLHFDWNERQVGKPLVPLFIEWLKNQAVDLLVIAGDISNRATKSIGIIKMIEAECGIPVRFIPGNHDIYTKEDNSWDSYELFKNHHSSLIESPFEIGDTVIIGDMGWYDYSFKPVVIDEQQVLNFKEAHWPDAKYAKWHMADAQVCELMLKKCSAQLDQFCDRKVVFVNHFVAYESFITTRGDIPNWNLGNAIMGSRKIGAMIDLYPNITHTFFGHTHIRYGVENRKSGVVAVCKPLGYTHEWKTNDFLQELEDCGTVLEL